ncbi:hypothetical protein ACJ51O_35570 (plasmid) [Burkholderia pyrrocinia]|uniref:hypothetical protein n=1 Tax=Burkholderia pyrrocinia TaxID=60550 RepID=UPI0038B53A62
MLPIVVNEQSRPSMALEMPTATDIPSGSIKIWYGKTSIRIESAPDPAVLRSVLDHILR